MHQTARIELDRLTEHEDLPALPQVSTRLLKMLDDPAVSAGQLAEVMKSDPALAGRILSMVNSPYHGVRQKVTSINQALALLGLRQVRALVLGAAMDGLFKRRCNSPDFDQQGCSLHAVACAAVAQHLARTTHRVDPELAFSLGLLHDIGKLAMDQCFPAHYTAVRRKAESEEINFFDAELTFEQPSHGRIGAALAEGWGLPADLVQSIRYHHELAEAPDEDAVAVLTVTHYICRLKNVGSPDEFAENRLSRDAWQQLEMTVDAIPALTATIDAQIASVREMFQL